MVNILIRYIDFLGCNFRQTGSTKILPDSPDLGFRKGYSLQTVQLRFTVHYWCSKVDCLYDGREDEEGWGQEEGGKREEVGGKQEGGKVRGVHGRNEEGVGREKRW